MKETKNRIKGKITTGKFKGDSFIIEIGETPSLSKVMIGNEDVSRHINKLTIVLDPNDDINRIELKWID